MCGRFFQDLDAEEVRAYFDVDVSTLEHEGGLAPRYNIGPGQPIWTVRSHPKTQQRSLDALHWGLIPHFAKDRKIAYRLINARSETIERTASFRTAFARRRCLVVASGFYEWRTEGKRKQPYAIAPSPHGERASPLAFAGVWENWMDEETGEWVRSVAIVTTEASPFVRSLHDRMPVILERDAFSRWLGEEAVDPADLKALLRPSPRQLVLWPVDPRMNRVQVEDENILVPINPQ